MPKVSIIVPVYNVEKYISRCLDSLINQTLADIEIICVNDGSVDSSLEILKAYASKDERIKIINQENKGLSSARNAGLNIASGDYVSFIDSDDWVSLNFFDSLYNDAQNTASDIAVAGIICHRKNKETFLLKYDKGQVIKGFKEKLIACNIPEHCYVWNKIYKRDFLLNSQVRFEDGRIYEDLLFTPQILYYANQIVVVKDAYYYYFRHKNTIVKRKNKKSNQDYEYAHSKITNFLSRHDVDVETIGKQIKKYKILGITVFKTITKNNVRQYVLFNIIRWKKII